MKEGIKIFSDKNIKKLEDAVGEFLNDPKVMFMEGLFSTVSPPVEYVYLIKYNQYEKGEETPKDKQRYKFRMK